VSEDWIRSLPDALGEERVRTDEATLGRHRRDTWVLGELRDLEGEPGPLPGAVIEPHSTEEAAEAVRALRAAGVPVVPYGGGSGVCGAVRVPEGAAVLSTARLEGLRELDDGNLLASFGAGTNGMEAERTVEEAGLTLGHWPQSIALSTVGGWVATRAAGQYSTAYGNVEDILFALEAVLPDGSVVRTRRTPRAASGPDLRQLFLGSEGTLGLVTETTFSLRTLPEARKGQAFHFRDLAQGLEAFRLVMRAGYRPPVMRLYDAVETKRTFEAYAPEGRALAILLHEGPEPIVPAEVEAVASICTRAGGVPSDAKALDDWLEHRNRVPGFRGFLERGIVVDTIEVAAPWDRVVPLYERVTTALREIPAVRVASAHSSHSYRSGTNLYFTFAARPEDPALLSATYRSCWRRTMAATLEVGGGIAHHHGIGRVRRDWLPEELGAGGTALLRAVKQTLDPEGLWNPGVLLPPVDDAD